jgi:hypothetical protein
MDFSDEEGWTFRHRAFDIAGAMKRRVAALF